jgi:hypothetical protein
MTDLVDPVLDRATPIVRLEPMVFMHARIAMVTATTSGTVVDVNPVAAELIGRARHELVQEPFSCYVSSLSGGPFDDCLSEASSSSEARSFGDRARSAGASSAKS